MKKTTPKKKLPKSRTQKAKEISASDFCEFISAKDSFSEASVYKKLFPRTVESVVSKKSKKAAFAMDSSGGIVPNDPKYIGFHQQIPSTGSIPEPILRHYGGRNFFIGWQACALLAKHNFIGKACSMPGEDAIAVGYKLVGGTKKKCEDMLKRMRNYRGIDIDKFLQKFEFNKRCFGCALAVPCFVDEIDMSEPLVDFSQLKGKQFLGWKVVDPYWTVPTFDEDSATNPLSKYFFTPSGWQIRGMNKTVHASWCLYEVNTMIADIFKPAYYWGGVSIPQLCYERLYAADKSANEAQMLLMSKRLIVMTANTQKMAAHPEFAKKTMENIQYNRDNWGILPVPTGTDVKQLDTYLSEATQLITMQYQLFCGIVEVPAPKMMMSPLTGFANSGDYEWKVYAANLRKIQEQFARCIDMTQRIINACDTGKEDAFDVKFNKIDIPTLVEESEISYENARAEKFSAEAKALKRVSANGKKSADIHKSALERASGREIGENYEA